MQMTEQSQSKDRTQGYQNIASTHSLVHSLFFMPFCILLLMVSLVELATAEYAVVYRKNGDRYTGVWRGGNERESVVELPDGQRLRIPTAEISYIMMTDKMDDLPSARAQEDFVRGKQFLELGMTEQAESAFRSAVLQSPRFADAHFALAELLESKGLVEEAMRSYGLAAQIAPNRFQFADRFKAAAETYLQNGEKLKAAEVLFEVAQRFSTDLAAVDAAYRAGFLFAEQYELSKQEASASMEEPTPEAEQTLSTLLDKAIQSLQRGLTDYTDHPDAEHAHYLIGWLHYEKGLYSFAYQQLTQFIEQHPMSSWLAQAYLTRGRAALAQRLNQEALADFDRALLLTTDGTIAAEARKLRNESAWQTYFAADGLSSNMIQALAIDGNYLWVGTPKGLNKFDTTLGGWQPVSVGLELPENLNVYSIAVDEANVWIGTLNNGLYRYNRQLQQSEPFLVGERISDIALYGDEVWIGTFNGLRYYNTTTGRWLQIRQGLPAQDVVTVAVTQDSVWVGTSQSGLGVYDKATRQWTTFSRVNGLPSPIGNSIRCLAADGDWVWFTWVAESSNGYAYYDPTVTQITGDTLLMGNLDPLNGVMIDIADQQAWIAYYLSVDIRDLISGNWNTVMKPTTLGEMTAIAAGDGTVWIGTDSGLGKIDSIIAARASEGGGTP